MTRSVFRPAGCTLSLPVAPVARQPVARIWPNGNFSLGTRKSVETLENLVWEDGGYQLPDWVLIPDAEGGAPALTSSNVLIPHEAKPRAKKGLKGITAHGQQMLRSAAYLVERDYGKSDICFATLTVPKLPPENRRKLQGNWARILNRLVQFVSRKLVEAGRPPKVFGCVEVQSQRLERSGEGYLHLHAIWPSHSNQAGRVWAVEWDEIRSWWKQAIVRFSGCEPAVWPRVELATVKKSAERYLGKYLSKGGGLIEEFVAAEGEESCPSQWWFMTAEMRHQIEDETISGETAGVLLDAIIQTAFDQSDLAGFEWVRHVDMRVGNVLKTVGWCGRLTKSTVDDIRLMVSPLEL